MTDDDITKLVKALEDRKEKELRKQLEEVARHSNESPKQIALQVNKRLSSGKAPAPPWHKGQLLWAGIALFVVTVLCNAMLSAFIINGATNTMRNELAAEMRSYVSSYVPKVPSQIKISARNRSLQPNGTARTDIQVTVLDQFEQPENGAIVEFHSMPPEMGTLQPSTAKTQGGIARSVFTAGQTPGEVRITALSGQKSSPELTIQLREIPKPRLHIGLSTEPSQQVKPGGMITFTFSIANNGDAPASGVEIFSEIPAGTSFVKASRQGTYQPASRHVTWKIGTLTPPQETIRFLIVKVVGEQPRGADVTLADYGVRDDKGEEIRGSPPVSLKVQEMVSIPTKLVLAVNPLTLPADGRSSAIVTATVFDQFGNPFVGDGYLDFGVSPPDTGSRIEPISVQMTSGEITTTFTSGQKPGEVTVTATLPNTQEVIANSIDIELTQTVMTTGMISITAHLFSDPGSNTHNIIIYQLPKGTPIDLLDEGQKDNNSQKVAVAVWVPKNIVKLDNSGHSGILQVTQNLPIAVGKTPDDPVNRVYGKRTLYKAKSNGMNVRILDRSGTNGYVQVRIEGWVLSKSIKVTG